MHRKNLFVAKGKKFPELETKPIVGFLELVLDGVRELVYYNHENISTLLMVLENIVSAQLLQDNCPMCHEKLYLSKKISPGGPEAPGQEQEEVVDTEDEDDSEATVDFTDSEEEEEEEAE